MALSPLRRSWATVPLRSRVTGVDAETLRHWLADLPPPPGYAVSARPLRPGPLSRPQCRRRLDCPAPGVRSNPPAAEARGLSARPGPGPNTQVCAIALYLSA